jgi:hypothetical protein
MAGSYKHCIKTFKDGTYRFRGVELLDGLGDAYEALEEMFDMIEFLSGGDKQRILEAHEAHCRKRYGGVHYPQTVDQFFWQDEDDEDEDDEETTDGN